MGIEFYLFGFGGKISLCSLGWPLTLNPPVSASEVLGLQACTVMPYLNFVKYFFFLHHLGGLCVFSILILLI
jgi:hypothetical protein